MCAILEAMSGFEAVYQQLNDAQRQAVEAIDGPLLVLAGPGTGKTQLLSARVASILHKTDTLPSSILCLTFTDAAALNMRDRLRGMIGEDAYDVHISTYHSFASDIIKAYPDFFQTIDLDTGQDSRMERPINELGQLEIVSGIVDSLPFSDPLRSSRYYIKSVVSTISDLKQANLYPNDLSKVAKENAAACAQLSPAIHEKMSAHKQIPRKLAVAQQLFGKLLAVLQDNTSSLAVQAATELDTALTNAAEDESTKPLTAWKNKWLYKDENDDWTFTNPNVSEKMQSLANIYQRYQQALDKSGQYDFNDMILKTLAALDAKPELRFNLQEKYQYILLDEFQDTNAAQFALVKALADHPVHEGRPNVMAVGDDDQGIFAFQGADIGNMVQFIHAFSDVLVVNLVHNYRSHKDVLHLAHNVAEQIKTRLHHSLPGISKDIEAAAQSLPETANINRSELRSTAAENGYIADTIAKLISDGADPRNIAVIAPKHAILESLVPFLNKQGIPVTYEKRENIFETPIVQGILLACSFLQAAGHQNMALMDQLLPQVLSLDYWQVPTETIWKLNWEHARRHQDDEKRWCERALELPATGEQTKFLLQLSSSTDEFGLELTLDYLTGAKPLLYDHTSFTSPLKQHYFSPDALNESSLDFYEAISHLSVIREQLRTQQAREEDRLTVEALLDMYKTYQEAEQPLINTHPIAQAEASVQLQTVYKAKGLEYDFVFLPRMHDQVWGSKASGGNNKLSLPANLAHIRHESGGEDTARRLLFVAITRAKHGLYLTSHEKSESGKKNLPVKYLREQDVDGVRKSLALPEEHATVTIVEREGTVAYKDIDTLWHSRHTELTPTLQSLLRDRLDRYIMSPTHLNSFTNVEYAGPYAFLLGTLLRFPEAPSPDSVYGDALHRALEQYQKQAQADTPLGLEGAKKVFEARMAKGFMSEADKELYNDRGRRALKTYLTARSKELAAPAGVEVDFRREGCALNDAVLTGKIDRLEIDSAKKTVRIIDFKSGRPSTKWGSTTKYLNYKQQLYFYVLLVELSRTYRDYSVSSAELEFIEPLPNGECAPPLKLEFKSEEYAHFKQLVLAVWAHIQAVDLPDISTYPESAAGMKQFEKDLTEEKIAEKLT
jgi:DNA helicase II / ATP-dependent DNA helicase PcrA